MIRSLLLVAVLPACYVNTSTPTALANIKNPTVSIRTVNDPTGIYPAYTPSSSIEVMIDDGSCVRIADDVSATVDGMPLGATSRGGWDESLIDGRCNGAAFAFVSPTYAAKSHFVIADTTATWTIDASKLFANDFELAITPGSPARVTWPSATSVKDANAELTDGNGVRLWSTVNDNDVVPRASLAITGNTFSISAPVATTGTRTLSVNATRTGSPEQCVGPARCAISVTAGRQFPLE